MDKERVIPQMISDPQHEPLEWVDMQEEEVDPLEEEDAQVGHQVSQEDHQACHPEEITIRIGMISRETMKAII